MHEDESTRPLPGGSQPPPGPRSHGPDAEAGPASDAEASTADTPAPEALDTREAPEAPEPVRDEPPRDETLTRVMAPTGDAPTAVMGEGLPDAGLGAGLEADLAALADQPPSRYTPARLPWLMGVLNVTLSAVVAVLWLWLPVMIFFAGIGGLFALGSGVIALFVWFFLQRGVNHVERLRSEAVYGEHILVPQPRRTLRTGFSGWLHQQWLILSSGGFWRSAAHHYVKALYGGFIGILVTLGIGFGVAALTSGINPAGSSGIIADDAALAVRFWTGFAGVLVGLVGIAVMVFSPWLDRALDRALLPPAKSHELAEQRDTLTREVGQLETARTGAVDAATTERLRIERDLHDGVQPMLVALSMKIGMARSKFDSDPVSAKRLVGEAHEDSKAAITELRQLARGIHPAVLGDRGLDAAISALAARSSVPVSLQVDVPAHVGKEAESVAYFVVAESLTNIAKHAGASHAQVSIRGLADHGSTGRGPGILQIVVTDNGAGGARIERGGASTGLAGLAGRVASAKGKLSVTSPVGGPTTIVVEVPCAS